MLINTSINKRLREYNISVNDGISYLLSLYYGHVSEYFPEDFIRKLNITKIFELDKSKTLHWNIPLFEEQITGFEWTSEWMELFENINKDRKGVKNYVVARMKKFFSEYPEYRVDDIMGATKMYIRNLDKPMYLKSSHKFIMEGQGAERYSMLLEWCEKYKNTIEVQNRHSKSNTMQ